MSSDTEYISYNTELNTALVKFTAADDGFVKADDICQNWLRNINKNACRLPWYKRVRKLFQTLQVGVTAASVHFGEDSYILFLVFCVSAAVVELVISWLTSWENETSIQIRGDSGCLMDRVVANRIVTANTQKVAELEGSITEFKKNIAEFELIIGKQKSKIFELRKKVNDDDDDDEKE